MAAPGTPPPAHRAAGAAPGRRRCGAGQAAAGGRRRHRGSGLAGGPALGARPAGRPPTARALARLAAGAGALVGPLSDGTAITVLAGAAWLLWTVFASRDRRGRRRGLRPAVWRLPAIAPVQTLAATWPGPSSSPRCTCPGPRPGRPPAYAVLTAAVTTAGPPGQSPAAVRTPVVTRHDHLMTPVTPLRRQHPHLRARREMPHPGAHFQAALARGGFLRDVRHDAEPRQRPRAISHRPIIGTSSPPGNRETAARHSGRVTGPDPRLELLLSRYPQSGPWPSDAARRALGAIEPAWGLHPWPDGDEHSLSWPPAGTGRRARGRARLPARPRSQPGAGILSGVWSGVCKTSVSTFRVAAAATGAD